MFSEKANGGDLIQMGAKANVLEKGIWCDKWTFKKYENEQAFKEDNPYDVVTLERANALLNTGINELWRLVTGASANHFDNANTQLGVGDDNTVVDVAEDTDLLAETYKTYKGMEDTYPTAGTNQKIVCRSIFGADDGNHDWREFVIKQDTSGICLNRLVSAQGTKAQGQIWTLDVEVTLT